MVSPFQEISFLTRSANRVEVLEALAEGQYTERELVEATGISDVTVGRILEDFAERGWLQETDGAYRASRVGELLAEDYRQLEDSMDLACRLGPVRETLPLEEMDFDLRTLTDARISDPETYDPLRAIDRWKQLLRGADRVVGTAVEANATTVVAEPYHEAVTSGELEFELVVSQAYYEAASARRENRTLLRELIEAGAEFYLASEQEFTAQIALFDDLATMTGYDDEGNLAVGIETRVETVREWIQDRYESYRATASPLTAEDFAE